MKKMIITLTALCAFGMTSAFAADMMNEDTMKKQDDSALMKKKAPMKHDGMAKKSGAMKHDDMHKKSVMSKEDDMMKKNADGMKQ